jgi:hypothetical protein
MATSQTQAGTTVYQIIQTRYVREKQIIKYLDKVHGEGNYKLSAGLPFGA